MTSDFKIMNAEKILDIAKEVLTKAGYTFHLITQIRPPIQQGGVWTVEAESVINKLKLEINQFGQLEKLTTIND